MIFSYLLNMQSHPSWVCGLKLFARLNKSTFAASHPSWGCGLKLAMETNTCCTLGVTPFVGVWIETFIALNTSSLFLSHPSWVCGLKLLRGRLYSSRMGHTLRGCVD